MKEAAGRLAFEQASAIKHRLARIEELTAQDYRFVRDVADFRYLLIQSGPTRRKARVFLANQAQLAHAADLDFPSKPEQLEQLLARVHGTGVPPMSSGGTGVPPVSSGGIGVPPASSSTRDERTPGQQTHRQDAHATQSAAPTPIDAIGRWRMGLVAHYLFSSPQRSGIAIHCHACLTTDEVAQRLEEGHELLHLSKPKPKG